MKIRTGNMSFRKIIVSINFFLMIAGPAYTQLDWKVLHERADIYLEDGNQNLDSYGSSMRDLYLKGLVFLSAHQDDRAKEMFEEILNRDDSVLEARWGLAEVFRRQHAYRRSRAILRDIISQRPQFAPAYVTLGYIEFTDQNFKKAIALAENVLRLERNQVDSSNYVRAYLIIAGARGLMAHHGGILAKVFQGSRVYSSLRKAQELKPDSADVFLGLGSYYLLSPSIAGGDIGKAQTYLQKAIDQDPLLVDAYVRLAQVFKVKGEHVQYEKYLEKAAAIDPQNPLLRDIQNQRCNFICL